MSTISTAGLHGEAFPDSTAGLSGWKSAAGHIAAILTALVMIAPGLAKLLLPFTVQTMFEQLLIPTSLSMAAVLAIGTAELFAGLLVLIPRYRRMGALFTAALLVIYMIYIGGRYQALVGRDCSCFPWLKRSVNLWFFPEDGALLAIALLAAWWSPKAKLSLKVPALLAALSLVFAGGAFAYANAHQGGIQVPAQITVDGKPFNLHDGRVFLFFYDPLCSHCDEASRHMATYKWASDVTIIGLPTNDPQYAASFVRDTKINARTSLDSKELRKLFIFTSPPYGVALKNGRVVNGAAGIVTHFDEPEPQPSLKQLGFVE